MKLTWRGWAARIHTYFDQGKDFLERFRGLLIAGAALKILGVPLWALAWLTPLVIFLYILVGYVWVKRGWYKELSEISALDRWTPLQVWNIWMQIKILKRLRIEINNFDTKRLPEEYLKVLASTKERTNAD